jgi:hypothetical protein
MRPFYGSPEMNRMVLPELVEGNVHFDKLSERYQFIAI